MRLTKSQDCQIVGWSEAWKGASMLRASRSALTAACLVSLCLAAPASAQGLAGTNNGEWPSYAGDLRNYHYSPLDQINASNFGKLEIAWRFHTDALGRSEEHTSELQSQF